MSCKWIVCPRLETVRCHMGVGFRVHENVRVVGPVCLRLGGPGLNYYVHEGVLVNFASLQSNLRQRLQN